MTQLRLWFLALVTICSSICFQNASATEFSDQVSQLRTHKYDYFIEQQIKSLTPYIPQIRLVQIGGSCPEGSNEASGCLAVSVIAREKIDQCNSAFCSAIKNSIIHVRNEGIFVDEMYLIATGYNSIVTSMSLMQMFSIVEMPLTEEFSEADKLRLIGVNRNIHLLARHLNMQRMRGGELVDILDQFRVFVESWETVNEDFKAVINLGYALPFLHEVGHWSESDSGYFEVDIQGVLRSVLSLVPNDRREREIAADKFAFDILGRIVHDRSSKFNPIMVFDSATSFPVTFLAPFRDFYANLAGFPYSDFAFTNVYESDRIESDCKRNLVSGSIRGKVDFLGEIFEDGLYAFTEDEFKELKKYVRASEQSSHPSYLERAIGFSKIKSISQLFKDFVGSKQDNAYEEMMPIRLDREIFSLSTDKYENPILGNVSKASRELQEDDFYSFVIKLRERFFKDDVDLFESVRIEKARICKLQQCIVVDYHKGDQRFRIEVFFDEKGLVALRGYGDHLRFDMDSEPIAETLNKQKLRLYFAEILSEAANQEKLVEILNAWSNQIVKENECEAWTENLVFENSAVVMTSPDIIGKMKILVLPQ